MPKKATNGHSANGQSQKRALWSGTVGFGLVQIPVSLVTAEKSHELAFHQLDKRDMAPIGYDRINKTTGKKVAWGDIVKGYEIAKGEFVIVGDEDFKKANVAATQTIDIQDFVDRSEINPVYYERPYYLVPGKRGSKAYAVLRDAMLKRNLVAIALVVIRTRQHLCAVLAEKDMLVLELLRFDHELEPHAEVGKLEKAAPREVKLAEQLIDGMVARWEPSKYKDSYTDDLLEAIHEKAETGKIGARHEPKRAAHSNVTDLLSLLKDSVARGKQAPSKKKKKPRTHTHKAA
ncbi:MAG: Ku protein [Polyangiaceae bacterium]